MNLRRTAASLVVAVVVVVLGMADPAHADPRYVLDSFVNVNSGKCLSYLWDNNEDNGDPAVQYTCPGDYPDPSYFDDHTARFELVGVPNEPPGTYFFRTYDTSMCLEVENFSKANFANVSKHICNGGPHQQWRLVSYGHRTRDLPSGWTSKYAQTLADSEMIVNVWSGKCLEVYGYGTENFASVTQYDCYGGLNQLWFSHGTTY